MFNPRGNIVLSTHAMVGEMRVSGRMPRLIITIKPEDTARRMFKRLAARIGITLNLVQELDNGFAYDAIGTIPALEELTNHWAVTEHHCAVNVRVPVSSGGSGEMTERAKRSLRFNRSPKVEKRAVEAKEELQAMTVGERQRAIRPTEQAMLDADAVARNARIEAAMR